MPIASTGRTLPRISVLTIVRGRRKHLQRQPRALDQSSVKPGEWIIVSMGEDPPQLNVGIETITNRVDGERELPLAKARRRAAELATGDVLVYLDVDCIPHPDCLGYLAEAAADGGLWMGDVRYLPKGVPASDDWTSVDLNKAAVPHPLLPELRPGEKLEAKHEMFWSLCFAVRSDVWETIGGFDPGYTGYGAEDTDVGFAARKAGVPFGYVGARVWHQHHSVCVPPLNHVEDLVANARRFHDRWNVWPMDKWLAALDDAGFVRFDPDANVCEVVRVPTEDEIAAATVDTPAGF